ncbi:hypothetical protein BHM03_00023047 [Ensete ventricosum]|nr:hypothetical protein BHM03_00023047 [Ensete ventricosum]
MPSTPFTPATSVVNVIRWPDDQILRLHRDGQSPHRSAQRCRSQEELRDPKESGASSAWAYDQRTTHRRYYLTGRNNVLNRVDRAAKAVAFGVPVEEVQEALNAQPGPEPSRQDSCGSADVKVVDFYGEDGEASHFVKAARCCRL